MRPELGHKKSNSCSEPFGSLSEHRGTGVMLAERVSSFLGRISHSYTSAASLYQNLWNQHVPTRRANSELVTAEEDAG